MRGKFFLLLLCAKLSAAAIAFVHIGPTLPPYMETALSQARLFNQCDIYLVASSAALKEHSAFFQTEQITPVACESLRPTSNHLKFLQNTPLAGFWKFASERLYYLYELMHTRNLSQIVHLESDNMLYCDIEELIPILTQHYPTIAATFDNEARCILGFSYFATPAALEHLLHYMSRSAHRGIDDMYILGEYKNIFGPTFVKHLPILHLSYLKSEALLHNVNHRARFANHIDEFQSIFDAAAIGQYLGGDLHYQTPGYLSPAAIFDPSLLTYTWELDSQGRKIPYAMYSGRKYRLNNLHIHCKKLERFTS